jgi:hypothetical protein
MDDIRFPPLNHPSDRPGVAGRPGWAHRERDPRKKTEFQDFIAVADISPNLHARVAQARNLSTYDNVFARWIRGSI